MTRNQIILIAGIVVIGGIGFGVYRLFTRYKRPNPNDDSTTM